MTVANYGGWDSRYSALPAAFRKRAEVLCQQAFGKRGGGDEVLPISRITSANVGLIKHFGKLHEDDPEWLARAAATIENLRR